ncbi:MAG: DedA family protein [Burkholderiales bacterium]|nr:DedA family protein [Burkholderiales bacterium]
MNIDWMAGLQPLLNWLSVPEVGLGAVFIVSLISATLLPMGSEPAVFGLVKLQPELFWPAVLVATAGNTVGGAISWWMGHGAHAAAVAAGRIRHRQGGRDGHDGHDGHRGAPSPSPDAEGASRADQRALRWLRRFGPKACLLSWLPVVGDPLCAVAGWLKLDFWPCVVYMAIGKFARYLTMTGFLLWLT